MLPFSVMNFITCILVVFGLIGNTSVFMFFMFKCRRTSTFFLIGIQAVADVCVCVMIFLIIFTYDMGSRFSVLRKLTAFFALWSLFFSTLVLTIIAIDRHRMIWAPHRWQITIKYARIIIICGGFFCGLWTMRSPIMFNYCEIQVERGNSSFVRNSCMLNETLATMAIVFSVCDFLFILVEFIVIAVCYSMIIFIIRKQAKLKKTLMKRKINTHMPQSIGSGNETALNEPSDTDNITTVKSYSANMIDKVQSRTAVDVHSAKYQSGQSKPATEMKPQSEEKTDHINITTTSAKEKRVVFMVMTVTGFFLICFFPLFVLKIVIRFGRSTDEMHYSYFVATLMVFLNSVINPFIYLVFNAKYRQFLTPRWFKCNQG
ncbi:annetocin receptor-like [Mya arenaria]|uniref:annetocin receptor-like n=1 Tax=Mya arenaria TaxID=6604 RepID=UPI0022E8AE17|nr:annetocin receptor-like [Mya arenaria]